MNNTKVRFEVTKTGRNNKTITSVHRKKTTAINIVLHSIKTNSPVMIEKKIIKKPIKRKIRKCR